MNSFRSFSAKIMGEIYKLTKRIDNTVRLGEIQSADETLQLVTIVDGPKNIRTVQGVTAHVGELVVYATNGGDSVVLGAVTPGVGSLSATLAGTPANPVIVGGRNHTISGSASDCTILGGSGATATHDRSVVIGGTSLTSTAAETVHVQRLHISNLPTAATGLTAGTLWNSSGTVRVA